MRRLYPPHVSQVQVACGPPAARFRGRSGAVATLTNRTAATRIPRRSTRARARSCACRSCGRGLKSCTVASQTARCRTRSGAPPARICRAAELRSASLARRPTATSRRCMSSGGAAERGVARGADGAVRLRRRRAVSQYPHEKEILLPPLVFHEVKSIETAKSPRDPAPPRQPAAFYDAEPLLTSEEQQLLWKH